MCNKLMKSQMELLKEYTSSNLYIYIVFVQPRVHHLHVSPLRAARNKHSLLNTLHLKEQHYKNTSFIKVWNKCVKQHVEQKYCSDPFQ